MIKKTIYILIFSFILAGCGVVKELTNLSRLQFKLANVESITLGGVSLNNKSTIRDFSSLDVLKLSTSFIRGNIPLKFVLNVEVKNPNVSNNITSRSDFKISSFPWRLLLDGKQTVQGNISSPVNIPGNKEISYIPVSIKFNLVNFIKDKGYKSLINLALNIARQKSSPTQLELFAKPVVDTPLGKINYPGELRIVSMNFTN